MGATESFINADKRLSYIGESLRDSFNVARCIGIEHEDGTQVRVACAHQVEPVCLRARMRFFVRENDAVLKRFQFHLCNEGAARIGDAIGGCEPLSIDVIIRCFVLQERPVASPRIQQRGGLRIPIFVLARLAQDKMDDVCRMSCCQCHAFIGFDDIIRWRDDIGDVAHFVRIVAQSAKRNNCRLHVFRSPVREDFHILPDFVVT